MNEHEPGGERVVVSDQPVVDFSHLTAPEQLAAISRIENVALVIVPDSLAAAYVAIPSSQIAATIYVPDGANVRVHTGALMVGGDGLGAADDVLIITGMLIITSRVTGPLPQRIHVVGSVLAPRGSEAALGPALAGGTGGVSYYTPADGQDIKMLSGQVRLSGAMLAAGQANDMLIAAGQVVITGEVTTVGYRQVLIAGQLAAPAASRDVIEPRAQVQGQVAWYQGNDPRVFHDDTSLGPDFFRLLDHPVSLVVLGDLTITAGVTEAMMREKITGISGSILGWVAEAEEFLGVRGEHAVGFAGGKATGGDVADGALVGGSVLVGEVGAQDEAAGAEGVGGAAQRWRVTVADGVVPHPAGGYRGRFRGFGCFPGELIVHPLQEHRQRAAEVGVEDLHPRVAGRDPVGDQVQDGDGVFHRRADAPRAVVVGDQRGAGGVPSRVQIQDGAAAVEFGKQERGRAVDQRLAQDGGGHRHTHHAQVVQGAGDLGDRGIDVRQGKGCEGGEPARVAGGEVGVLVVDVPSRAGRCDLVWAVGQLRGGGQHLHADPGAVHQREPGIQFGAVPRTLAALRGGVVLTKRGNLVEVVIGPEMSVHVDGHRGLQVETRCRPRVVCRADGVTATRARNRPARRGGASVIPVDERRRLFGR
jgi:hypothetical protein